MASAIASSGRKSKTILISGLRFSHRERKIDGSYMDSQDTITLYVLKLWPKIEANKNRIIIGAVAFVVLLILIFALSYQRSQREISAGEAFSQLLVTIPPSTAPATMADDYLKMAADYSGTMAAQRAELVAATDLFTAGRYADAQAGYQKFVNSHPGSPLISIAALGVAASEDAQGNPAAADAYRSVIETYTSPGTSSAARFALAAIAERQGKILDAINYYQEVARAYPGTTLASQAGQRAAELSATMASKTPATTMPASMAPKATAPAPAFQLSK